MALNFNLLRSFLAVADAGSISRAAEDSFISQPALSKAVRELEKQVGLGLFERTTRGVVLTEAGKVLHEHARALFALERATEEALDAVKNLEEATLRVGASNTIATHVLPPYLGEYRRLYPRVALALTHANTREIEEKLAAYELDVALIEGPSHDPRIDVRPWREEELICVCGAEHPLASRDMVYANDLRQYSWIMREEGSGTREVIEKAMAPYQLPSNDVLEIGDAEALKQAVAAGLGISFVSREAASDQIAVGKLKVLRVSEIEIRRPFYILHLKNRPIAPAARVFEALLADNKNTKTEN